MAVDVSPIPDSYNYANGRVAEMDKVILNSDYQRGHEKYFFKYDVAGNITQEDYQDSIPELDVRWVNKYNKKNLLIEQLCFFSDGKKPVAKTAYHYTSFDAKGNWLVRVGEVKDLWLPMQEMHEPVLVRKITYY